MFVSNKKVEEIEASLQGLQERVRQQTVEVSALKETHQDLQTELDDSRQTIEHLKEGATNVGEQLKTSMEQINNEVVELKMFFSTTKKELTKDLTNEFRHEMAEHTKKIESDLETFHQVKIKMQSLLDDATSMKEEMVKFLSISQQIKEQDFHLKQYAEVLEKNDREKLELMKKIDSMERLVAKQRTGPRF